MTEEEYEKSMEAWERMRDYAKECYEEGIDPFTGKKLKQKRNEKNKPNCDSDTPGE